MRPIGPPLIWKHEQAWCEHWKAIGAQVNATRLENLLALQRGEERASLEGAFIFFQRAQSRAGVPTVVNRRAFVRHLHIGNRMNPQWVRLLRVLCCWHLVPVGHVR